MGKQNTNGNIPASIVIFPTYQYAKLNCDEYIVNINFDMILREIGTYYYKLNSEASLNKICSLIKDTINTTWHLNRVRKRLQLKNVTTNQIKAIRHSFYRKKSDTHFVRIPFNVISIIFFILYMYNSIDSPNQKNTINYMKNDSIGTYLYNEFINVALLELPPKIAITTNTVLNDKLKKLLIDIKQINSLLNKRFNDITWTKQNPEYKID